MKHLRNVLIVIVGVGAMRVHAEPDAWHELVFIYDSNRLQPVRSTPLPAMRKKVRSPGAGGALGHLPYEMEWRDVAGRALLTVSVQLPFGTRVPLPETPNETSGGIIPKSGYVVVRVPSPTPAQHPASIRMMRQPVPLTFQGDQVQMDLPNLPADISFSVHDLSKSEADGLGPLAAGPRGCVKLRDTGPDENRLVLVIMGDGYTAENLGAGAFSNDVVNFLAQMKAKPPWDILWDGLNIYRIDIESNQEGADYEDQGPPSGTLKDTYLNASFWGWGIERLLCLDTTGIDRAFSAANEHVGAGLWDQIIVLVNSTKYGGSGGSPAVCSVESWGADIMAHELGHSFAGLADEYYDADGTTYSAPNPSEPNIDVSATSPKWNVWIQSGTPLPTPDSSVYDSTVGTFEGAYYKQHGIYRPYRACKMRGLDHGFCPVCQEAHLLEFLDLVMLTDYEVPAAGSVVDVDGSTNLVLGVIPISGMRIEWAINGEPFSSGAPTLTVTSAHLPLPTNTISAVVAFDSTSVRATTVSEVFSWTLLNLGRTARGTPYWWLVGYGLDPETDDTYDEGDGVQAWQEYIADTDPTNRNSYFRIAALSNIPPRTVYFESSSNRLYTLQWTTNLVEGVWTNVAGQDPRPGVSGQDAMTDTNDVRIRFYRLKVQLP